MGEHRKKKDKKPQGEYQGKHRGEPRASSDPSKCEHPGEQARSNPDGGTNHHCPHCGSKWWTR